MAALRMQRAGMNGKSFQEVASGVYSIFFLLSLYLIQILIRKRDQLAWCRLSEYPLSKGGQRTLIDSATKTTVMDDWSCPKGGCYQG